MNHTLTAPVAGVAVERSSTKLRPGLLGGIGGLVFAGLVIVQNAIRSGFPMNDASTQDVMRYYTDHRSATIALSVLFPIGLVALTTFLGTEGMLDEFAVLGRDGVPVRGSVPSYPTPERAVAALGRAVRYARWRTAPPGETVRPPGINVQDARALVDRGDGPLPTADCPGRARRRCSRPRTPHVNGARETPPPALGGSGVNGVERGGGRV